MKKKLLVIVGTLLLVLALVACGGGTKKEGGSESSGGEKPAASGKSIDLKMSVTSSEASTWVKAANRFKEIVEDKTGGRYTISVFPNEQLSSGNQQKGVEMLFTGVNDVDIHSTIIMSMFDQKFSMPSMPFLFKSYDDVDKILFGEKSEARDLLFNLVREKGAEPLALMENGFRQPTNNKRPLEKVADYQGIKMRVPGMQMYIDLFTELGCDPTAMSWSEVFTALQQGTIDGEENPLDTIESAKITEVQKYLTMNNYSYDPLILSVSKKTWDSLSDEDKAIFKEAATTAAAEQVKMNRDRETELLEKYKAGQIQVYEATPEDKEELKAKLAPIYDKYRDQIGDDWYKAFGYEG